MGVQHIRPPFIRDLLDTICKRRNLAPFANRGRAEDLVQSTVKIQPRPIFPLFQRFIAMLILAHNRNTRYLQTPDNLPFHYGTGPETKSAVQGQAVVQYVQNPRHGEIPCLKRINVPSTQSLYRTSLET